MVKVLQQTHCFSTVSPPVIRDQTQCFSTVSSPVIREDSGSLERHKVSTSDAKVIDTTTNMCKPGILSNLVEIAFQV